MKCTWEDCKESANAPQVGADGFQWANLCNKHNKELDDAIVDFTDGRPEKLVRAWILAQGGSKEMARSM